MTSTADYSEKIPNNVDLHEDRRLQRALESLAAELPRLVGVDGARRCRPRTSTCAPRSTSAARAGRTSATCRCRTTAGASSWPSATPTGAIAFGQHKGEPAWQKVPGEYRADLQRLIVIQGDTEPASRRAAAPPRARPRRRLYDLRNLFQVNVEEGRHLWAMVYLLHAYFGREGREEAEELLHRNSGSEDSPRILGAFNEETPDWLSFFMFTYFTDRDGKYQLGTLKESAFDPLSRTCEFMLKEEAHHMFVGTTGVDRVVRAHRRS